MPLTGSCHCGRVRLTIPSKPAYLNDCQCTLCFKYGARWCYFPKNQVEMEIDVPHSEDAAATTATYALSVPEAASPTPLPGLALYIRTDVAYKTSPTKTAYNRCAHCGTVVFWVATLPSYAETPDARMGVNGRLFSKMDMEGVELRMNPGPP